MNVSAYPDLAAATDIDDGSVIRAIQKWESLVGGCSLEDAHDEVARVAIVETLPEILYDVLYGNSETLGRAESIHVGVIGDEGLGADLREMPLHRTAAKVLERRPDLRDAAFEIARESAGLSSHVDLIRKAGGKPPVNPAAMSVGVRSLRLVDGRLRLAE